MSHSAYVRNSRRNWALEAKIRKVKSHHYTPEDIDLIEWYWRISRDPESKSRGTVEHPVTGQLFPVRQTLSHLYATMKRETDHPEFLTAIATLRSFRQAFDAAIMAEAGALPPAGTFDWLFGC